MLEEFTDNMHKLILSNSCSSSSNNNNNNENNINPNNNFENLNILPKDYQKIYNILIMCLEDGNVLVYTEAMKCFVFLTKLLKT